MFDKLTSFRRGLATLPTPLAGLALGVASLGWGWEHALDLAGTAQFIGAYVGAILLLLLLLKFVFHPSLFIRDMQHHVVGSVMPTFTMASMVVANCLAQQYFLLGLVIWCTALVTHLLLLTFFAYYRLRLFKFEHVLPSWFIPPVGIVVAVVTFPGGALKVVAEYLMLFGLLAYSILLPVVLIRLCYQKLTEAESPTIAVLAAPASLCLCGYLIISDEPSTLLVLVLGGVAIIMTSFVYVRLLHLLTLPFTPAFSAFTFPLVIGATALYKTNTFLVQQGFDPLFTHFILLLANVELLIATAMVGYVIVRYAIHQFPALSAFTK